SRGRNAWSEQGEQVRGQARPGPPGAGRERCGEAQRPHGRRQRGERGQLGGVVAAAAAADHGGQVPPRAQQQEHAAGEGEHRDEHLAPHHHSAPTAAAVPSTATRVCTERVNTSETSSTTSAANGACGAQPGRASCTSTAPTSAGARYPAEGEAARPSPRRGPTVTACPDMSARTTKPVKRRPTRIPIPA